MSMRWHTLVAPFLLLLTPSVIHGQDPSPNPIKIIFLGDKGHHRPADLAGRILPALKAKGIDMDYTEDLNILSKDRLSSFDGLLIYANIDEIKKEQETALLNFVASGKGFIPLHCATYCFRNSEAYVALCGAQFRSHGGEVFETVNVAPEHPIMKGFGGFKSWDETYVHTKHNEQDRVVLEVRRQGGQAAGKSEEPWTWVRTHGKGRVFYTAWGHDIRTWSQPGFINLLERGIRWAVGRDPSIAGEFDKERIDGEEPFVTPKITEFRKDVKPFSYSDVGAKIPNYTPSTRWGVQGAPHTRMQDPLPPDESIKHFVTPEQFAPQLWVSEPQLIGKPIAMNWDARGRLWVCETVDYPNELQPQGAGHDRIRICNDTDGDGRADQFTVFAEKLTIPTAIEFYRGGILVQDGKETVYLKDLDGDDRADMRQVLITGWALGDTHGGVSNFQYGPDNWIWSMQGYNDSHPVINGEEQQGFRQGFWRFRVETGPADDTAPVTAIGAGNARDFAQHTVRVKQLEFIRATNNNTWGIGISEEGLIFGSTANGNPSNFMPIPNRYYERVRGFSPSTLRMISDTHKFSSPTDKIRQVDWHGSYTAGAGHALYTSRKYPKSWWNRVAFVCEPTGHLVGTFVLNPEGANYKSHSPFNLIASDDEWSSPIMAEVGPDGQIWMIDWYNYIVQHNPTPQGFKTGKGAAYESDLRDKVHGRIYRIVYQGETPPGTEQSKRAESMVAKGLEKGSNADLISVLSHPTMRWRLMAQRLLIERQATDTETVNQLLSLVSSQNKDALGLSVSGMHALWTLHGLQLVQPSQPRVWEVVSQSLQSSLPGIRRAALNVLPAIAESGKLVTDGKLIADAHPQVRLAALLRLAETPAAAEVAKSIAVMDPQILEDTWLLDAWTAAAAQNAEGVLSNLLASKADWPSELMPRAAIIATHLARSRPTADQIGSVLSGIKSAKPDHATTVLEGLARGWPSDYSVQISNAVGDQLVASMESLPPSGKSLLVQLASRWGASSLKGHIEKIAGELFGMLKDDQGDAARRIDAAKQLVIMQSTDDQVVDQVLEVVSPQLAPDVARGVIDALRGSKSSRVASSLIDRASSFTPESKDAALRVLMARPETTTTMLEAIQQGKLSISDLQLDQQQALRDHPQRRIRDQAVKLMSLAGGIPNEDRAKLLEEWKDVCEHKGDGAKGKQLFTKHCSACHQHTGEGQNIGPDLTGMAVHPKHELLIHILDPNRSVEGNFRVYNLLTMDGIMLTGMLVGESRTTVELVDAQGKRQALAREDIDRLTASRKSLMPEGFEKQLNQAEMTDLLEFLGTKGKYVPMPLNKYATAVSTKGLFHDGDNGPDRMIFSEWKPQTIEGVPFVLVDPQGKRIPNIILLNGPQGTLPPKMPNSVTIPCSTSATALHFLSGVSGWGYPAISEKSVSMIVRLRYEDGATEDHSLLNGVHFADYIRRVDVPESKFAARLGGQQIRYLKVTPKRPDPLKEFELVKGPDASSPIVMAITVETR
jgi:hypothetical protein